MIVPHRPYRPPAPVPSGMFGTFLNVAFSRDADLLSAIPRRAYEVLMGERGMAGRRLYLVNAPETAREIMVDRAALYPKSRLFSDALAPLVGDGIFVSNGETWRRQREMIRPALSGIALSGAYPHMTAAVADCVARLDRHARDGTVFQLDAELSHVTADVVFRTIFSQPIEGAEAASIFEAFARYQELSDQLVPRRLLYGRGNPAPSRADALQAATDRIRDALGRIVDRRIATRGGATRDIAGHLLAATDAEGRGFDRDELVDQIAVFFLAGHETTASMLCWTFVILAALPEVADALRAEAEPLGDAPPLDALSNALPATRLVLREVLRLYPPVGFLIRSPTVPDRVRRWTVTPEDIVVVSPWIIHRHHALWRDPDLFDASRFAPDRAEERSKDAYIPFGLGPRVCPGASFATVESTLLLARILTRFDVMLTDPARIRPTARLTIRPAGGVPCRVRRRASGP